MKVDPPPVNKIDVGVADEQPPSPREAPEGERTFASAPPPAERGDPKKDPKTEETDGSDGSKDGDEEEKEPDVCSIAELFQFADGVDIVLMIVGSIAAAIAGAGMPAFSEVFGRLMNELSSNDLSTVEDRVGDVAFIMFLIGIAIFVLSAIFVACWMVAAERQSARIREKFFEALMRQECAFHDENKPGGLAARLTGDTKVIKVGINDKVALGIMNMFMFFTGFGLGFYRSWELTLLMLGTLPFIAAGGAVISIIATQMASSSRTYFAKAGEISDEVLSNVKTVQVFGNEEKEVERFSRELDGASWANTRKEFMSLGGVGVTYAIMFLSYALAFWFSSVLIDKGRNNAGEIVTVFFAVMMGSFGLGLAMPTFSALADARGAAFKVLEVIKRDTLIDVDTPGKSKLSQFNGQVQFKNVRFSYPTRKDTTLFTDLNLTVTAGSTVAFAGASGCGKSSLIALAQRQYDPDAGTVEIDGVDLKDIDLRWWRDQVGVVSQEPNLFSGSVADNVRVGKPDATQAEVEAACKQADIHHTIMGLPDQYETSVGAVGSQLSGGQKQRLAIARAIVKDPKFLILDEATSALDRKSEVEVQTALDKLMSGDGSSKKRTVFVIAHRLVTIQNVDKIYFVTHDDVSGSAIAESGSFSELMAMNGLFAHMVSKQGKSGLGAIGEGAQGTSSSSDDDAAGGAATGAGGSPAKPTKTPLSARNRRGSFVGQDPEKPDKKETLEEAAKREVEETDVPTLRLLHMTAEKWWSIVLGLIGSVLSGGLFPAYAVVFSKMLKVLAQGSADEVRDDAPFWAYMFIAIAAAAFIGWSMQGFYAFAGEFLTHKLRVALLRNLLRQDATFFDTPNRDASSLCAVLSGDCEAIHLLWGPALGYKVQMACNLIVGITLGLVHSWRVALVTMAGLPLVIVSGMIQQVALAGFGTAGESPEDQIVLESLANIRTVHAFNQDRIRHQNYVEAVAEGKKAGIRTGLIAGFAYGFSQFAIYGVFALSFWYGGKLIGQGKVNFEDMMIASMAVLMSAMGAGEAGGFAAKAADAGPAAQRVFALVDRKPGIDVLDDGDTSISLTKGADIDFTHVSFSYPSRPDSKILKKFSDHFGSGHAIGLMGSTGCGKSTIVQLLARYYDPGHGHILIDGKDLRSIDLKTWRKALSVVSQEPSLFSGTVIDNIRYACPDAKDDEVFRVAKLAAIHDDILGMEKGYDTEVGYKGKMLSGGQKQRVAIARGLLRKPKLLLLDEATSALDPATEAKVQEGIATACKEGHTTVVSVAHRLTTIQDSNKIVLLDNGVVLEEGTHAELMAMDGDYCARYQQYTAKS